MINTSLGKYEDYKLQWGKTYQNYFLHQLIMFSVQICTFNVKGLASTTKRDRVLCWLNQQKFHLCCCKKLIKTQSPTILINGSLNGTYIVI